MRDVGVLVQPAQVPALWPWVQHWLAKADGYRSTADDLYPLLCRGERQLWLCLSGECLSGACITRLAEYPQCKAVVVTTLGGDGGDWNAMLQDVEDYARAHGCDRLEIQGRRGWLRALQGYQEVSTVISKELGE